MLLPSLYGLQFNSLVYIWSSPALNLRPMANNPTLLNFFCLKESVGGTTAKLFGVAENWAHELLLHYFPVPIHKVKKATKQVTFFLGGRISLGRPLNCVVRPTSSSEVLLLLHCPGHPGHEGIRRLRRTDGGVHKCLREG